MLDLSLTHDSRRAPIVARAEDELERTLRNQKVYREAISEQRKRKLRESNWKIQEALLRHEKGLKIA